MNKSKNKSNILIGKESFTGKNIILNDDIRSTHMQIIGASGEGKSKLMEHLIREDIRKGNGVCLIDPHGYLYNDVLTWCADRNIESIRPLSQGGAKNYKVRLLNPSKEEWSFGFNPLATDPANISFHVDSMVKAVSKVWGGENSDKTPLLKRILRILFHGLSENNLTLLEADFLLDPYDSSIRAYIAEAIKDPIIKRQWSSLNSLKPSRFFDEVGSTNNRMIEFLSNPIIRKIIGQLDNTINFRESMDNGEVLLVNLSSSDKISEDNSRLLGTLIVNELFQKAKARPPKSKPFYIYIDECSLFINNDIARILDEGRKFGIHLILAHQHLDQLRGVSESVYKSVLTDAKTKVVFGGLSYEDAEILTRQLYLGELNLQEYKQCLKKFEVVDYTTTYLRSKGISVGHTDFESFSYSKGKSSSKGKGDGSMRGASVTSLPNTFIGEGQEVMNMNNNAMSSFNQASEGESEAYGESFGFADSASMSEAISEALTPILEEKAFKEYSLEEQVYRTIAKMVNQPARHYILKLPKKPTKSMVAPFIKSMDFVSETRITKYEDFCLMNSSFCSLNTVVENEIQVRHNKLLEAVNKKSPEEPEEWKD